MTFDIEATRRMLSDMARAAGMERSVRSNVMPEEPTRHEIDAKLAAARAEMSASVFELRGDMRTEFASVRGEMREGFAKLGTGIESVRTEIANSGATVAKERAEYTKWLLGIVLTLVSVLVVGFGTLGLGLYNALKSSPQQQAQVQPVASIPPAPAASR